MPERCPDCNGKGEIELLTSTRPCPRCAGTGVFPPAAPPASLAPTEEDGYALAWVGGATHDIAGVERTEYDKHGRIVFHQSADGRRIDYVYYGDEGGESQR